MSTLWLSMFNDLKGSNLKMKWYRQLAWQFRVYNRDTLTEGVANEEFTKAVKQTGARGGI
jgi:hypothetical protein